MNARAIEKKWKKAEADAERWDRTLAMAVNKVRVYRRRAKYYRGRLDAILNGEVVGRSMRKIRTDGLL